MTQARVIYFGLVVIYLGAVVVQFFLAGLWAFGNTSIDPHSVLGLILGLVTLILLVLAFVGKVPRAMLFLTLGLVGLNILEIVLARIEVDAVAALHVVNALAILFVAHELMQRSRRYLTSKLDASS